MGVISDLIESATGTTPDFLKDIILLPGEDIDSTAIYNFFTGGAYSALQHSGAMASLFFELLIGLPEEQEASIVGNKSSNVAKRPVIYGSRGRVGGTRVFVGSSGTDNEFLHIVLDICEGEIEAIDDVYLNDVISTDEKFDGLVTITKYVGTVDQAADADLMASFTDWTAAHQLKGIAYVHVKVKYDTTAFGGFPRVTCDIRGKKVKNVANILSNPHFTGAWSGSPLVPPSWAFTGTIDANNTMLEDDEGAIFQSDGTQELWLHQGSVTLGKSYRYVVYIPKLTSGSLKLSESGTVWDTFTSAGWHTGSYTAVTNGDIYIGNAVADPVVDGVAAYVHVFEETLAYSANPALCTRDYLTDVIYGKGLPESLMNEEALETAAAYHDTLVQIHEGTASTFPLLECNMFLDTAATIVENTKLLLASARAALPRTNGKYTMVVEKDEVASFSFNKTNIIGAWSFSGTPKSGKLNEVEVVYTNEDLDWKSDVVAIASSILYAEDGNFVLSTNLRPQFITDQYHARDYGELAIKRSRQGIVGSFIASPAALSVVPGAVIDITHDTPGWAAKKFRVTEMALMPHGLVALTWIEHESTVYDRDVPVEFTPPVDTNLPTPGDPLPPTNIVLASGDSYLKLAGDGTIISLIYATWGPPVGYPYTVKYDVEFKPTDDADWIPAPSVLAASGESTLIGPVDDGVFYKVRIRTSGPKDVKSAWLNSSSHSVLGKLEPPPDVTTLSVIRQSDGTRQFSWTLTDPPADLAGYKIRFKLSADQVWADMAPIHDGVLTSSPYETNQLAAGIYTLGIKAVDTSGNESANAVLINSTLGDPRIPVSIFELDVRRFGTGWPGTLTDCWHSKSDGIIYAEDQKTWADFATDLIDWDNWTEWARNPKTPIMYEHTEIDLGADIAFIPLVTVSGNGTVVIEEQHKLDGGTYTSWAVASGQIIARYVKIRVTVTKVTGTPSIIEMHINLSAKVVEEDINDLVTSTISSPAGVLRLPLSRTYSTITQVQIALQNVGAGWTWELIDKNPSTGPQIKIYDSTNTLADATIDAHIKGV